MKFYGFQKLTLLDYPEEVAATIFTGGCNLRCPFCHNKDLVFLPDNLPEIEWKTIYDYLKKRKSMLGGVCITGGEPLLYDRITGYIEDIKGLGLKVKIDTNGTNPQLLKKLKVDYVAMDIKTSLEKYHLLGFTGKNDIEGLIKDSIEIILNLNIKYEFRTTVVPDLVNTDDIIKICDLIKPARKYVLAQFRPKNLLDTNWENIIPYKEDVLREMKSIVEKNKINCELRLY
ncbi:MAG TPA: anaerobic ribonucleoside-triphosphate reductase activating protein [Spirochaetota bacterium]|nr:anaerobic ribonucleoside-triphosphate reductase activating protein [Spirochaetota bacterium]